VTFGFDLLGNLVEKHEPRGTWRYHWNGDGMLAKVERPDGVPVEMAYDALGRRVSKKVGGRETRWIWDGDVVLHEIKPERPTVTWYHEPESFTPVLRVEDGRVRHHVVADHLGTPTAIYDDGGGQVWHQQLDVFGVPRLVGGAGLCAFRWPGQVEDAETGLYYNRFRYYDARLGEYVRQDPIGVLGGLQVFQYVSDPTWSVDPYGLIEMDPWTINFSQRSVGSNVREYAELMRQGQWDWSKGGPLRVMEVQGQYVSYDNRRLLAAQLAGQKSVPVTVVEPSAMVRVQKVWMTWTQAFAKRMRDDWDVRPGDPVSPQGYRRQPRIRGSC
jgi:RHS repeat-associated protein